MAMKAKHAFGALERVDESIKSGVIDSYDVLFVKDSEGKPYVGWVSKDGQKEIVDPYAEVEKLEIQVNAELKTKADASDVSALETEIAAKADASDVESLGNQIAAKADATEVEELGAEVATKANADEVEVKINETVATAKAYTDGKVEAAISEHMEKKYEIADVPVGTLVDYHESEIRVMCPENAVFTKQNVGAGGDANSYYMTFKTYVYNDNIVGYIEHLNGEADTEVLTTFSTDEYGRRYQPTWLALAKYDETSGTWTYYGKNSTKDKYIGWDYQIDWYDANGVMIASDCIRINLSNKDCHSVIEPYYVTGITGEVDTKIDEAVGTANAYTDAKIAEIAEASSYEIIEF